MNPQQTLISLLLALWLSTPSAVFAENAQAEAAVVDILFDEDMENASFTVSDSGRLDITFGAAVSDEDYGRILRRLKSHPNIEGVIAGRGAVNFCPVP